jgi:hypothetical protein
MGGNVLHEHKHCKKGITDLNLNTGDESLVSCCIYQLTVLKVSVQTTLVIKNPSIPQSVNLHNGCSHCLLFLSLMP